MKQRLLTGIIALMLTLFAAAPVWAEATSWTQGAGTAASPYLIESLEHLEYLADQVNSGTTYQGKYFRLTVDITLPVGYIWTPIGTMDGSTERSFRGNFDGGRHSIFHMQMQPQSYMGFFGITNGATITNLYIESAVNTQQTETTYMGCIVGWAKNTAFTECQAMGSNHGKVESPVSDLKMYAGGLVGYAQGCTFNSSHNYSSVQASDSIIVRQNVTNKASTYAGGVVGYSDGCTYICVSNNGSVVSYAMSHLLVTNGDASTRLSSSAYGGGITGYCVNTNTFTSCYNAGSVHSTARADNLKYLAPSSVYTGGISGYNGTMNHCYNVGAITTHTIWGSSGREAYAAGIGNNATVSDSYNAGQLVSTCPQGRDDDHAAGVDYTAPWRSDATKRTYKISSRNSVTNCYYRTGCCNTPSGTGTQKNRNELIAATMVSNYLNKNGNFYIQDTENINNSYPIFATCKPYATTLEVVAVDSTHATIKGAYKYLTSAQAVGFEYKLVGERDFTSVTFPTPGGNPATLEGTLNDLLRGHDYWVRFWLDENDIRYYGDSIPFSTTCPKWEPVIRDTVCSGTQYDAHGYRISQGIFAFNEATGIGQYPSGKGTHDYVKHLKNIYGCDSIVTL